MIELGKASCRRCARAAGAGSSRSSTSVKQPLGNLALSNAYRVALVAAMKTLAGEVAPTA